MSPEEVFETVRSSAALIQLAAAEGDVEAVQEAQRTWTAYWSTLCVHEQAAVAFAHCVRLAATMRAAGIDPEMSIRDAEAAITSLRDEGGL